MNNQCTFCIHSDVCAYEEHYEDVVKLYEKAKNECGKYPYFVCDIRCSRYCKEKTFSEAPVNTKTYGDIFKEFCDKFPNAEVEDYRPAGGLYVQQLLGCIPNAIVIWLKDGNKIIYISESEDKK